MPFKNRWRITGTLTTTTPLHIGNGETRTTLVDDSTGRGELRPVEVAAVATDAQGRAYLPGTTLKGTLRAWLSMHIQGDMRTLEAVFGSEDPGAPQAVGGKAEFWDACAIGLPNVPPQVPYWNADRLIGVTVAVAIERRTRTASPNKLFYTEFIPPEIQFQVTVTGQDLEPEELDLLLVALEGVNNATHPLTIGSGTGNTWGRCAWQLDDLARLGKEEVKAWLQRSSQAVGYEALVSFTEAERAALLTRALSSSPSVSPASLTLTLAIHCDGPFLVNDPSRTNTVGRSSEEHLGAPGWRAPVAVSDFCLAAGSTETPFWQEFLAIDRFTGGGAEGLKFNAMAVYRPTLTGTLAVDLLRVEPWALGLLALTLRDLVEGDVSLGFGAAKGYGACHVAVTGVRVSGLDTLPVFQTLLKDSEAAQVDWHSLNITTVLPTEVELVVLALVEAFQHRVNTFQPYMSQTGGKDALS